MDNSQFNLIPHWVARRTNLPQNTDPLSSAKSATGCYATFELESAICDALGVVWHSPTGLPGAGFSSTPLKSTNIFREAVGVQCFSTPKDMIGWAEGLALSGQRVAIWLSVKQLMDCVHQIRECVEKNIALNIHLYKSPESAAENSEIRKQLDLLADMGSQIWLCAANADLMWQSTAGRKISENLKTPNLIFHNSSNYFWVPSKVQFPKREEIFSFFNAHNKSLYKDFDLGRPMLYGSRFSAEIEPLKLFSKKTLILDKYKDVIEKYLKSFGQHFANLESPHSIQSQKIKGNAVVVLENILHPGLEASLEFLSKKLKKKIDVLRYSQFTRGVLKFPQVMSVNCDCCFILGYSKELMLTISGELQSLFSKNTSIIFLQLSSSQTGIGESRWYEILKTKPSTGLQFIELESLVSFPQTKFPKRQAHFDAIRRDLGTNIMQAPPRKKPFPLPYKNMAYIFPLESYAFPLAESLYDTFRIKEHLSLKMECISLNSRAYMLSMRWDMGKPEYLVSESKYDILILKLADAFFGFDPFIKLEQRGKILLVEGEKPNQLKYKLPKNWKQSLMDLDAQCYCISSSVFEDNKVEFLSGKIPDSCEVVSLDSLSYQHEDDFEPFSGLRRWKKLQEANRDVSNFWGSWIEPYQAGENIFSTPEIHAATSEVPPSTSAFHNTWLQRNQMPKFIPENCNGCSHCWTVCPDNAFSAKAFEISEMLFSLASMAPAVNVPGKLKRYIKLFPPIVKKMSSKGQNQYISQEMFSEAVSILLENIPETEKSQVEEIFSNIGKKFGKLRAIHWKALTEGGGWNPSAEPVLLNLEINPFMCKGCGVCVEACQPAALKVEEDFFHDLEVESALWKFHDELPFSSNKIVGAIGETENIPNLAGLMLSPYANFSMVGGTYSHAGSGEMLALRRMCCLAEYSLQSQTIPYIEKLELLKQKLSDAIQNLIGQSFNQDVQLALGEMVKSSNNRGKKQISLESLSHELSSNGKAPNIQNEKLLKLGQCLSEVSHQLWIFKEGPNGLGRSRFGMLITSQHLSQMLAKFPYNPFSFPVVVSINNPEAALGLQTSLLKDWAHLERLFQIADLYLEWPGDVKAREASLNELNWKGLTDSSVAIAPKVLVVGDENLPDNIPECGNLPIKFFALYSNPFKIWKNGWQLNQVKNVQSSSLFQTDHFTRASFKFLETANSSLLSLYCPNPNYHGYPSEKLMEHSEICHRSGLWPHFERNIPGDVVWKDQKDGLKWEQLVRLCIGFCQSENGFNSFVRVFEGPPSFPDGFNVLELDFNENLKAYREKNLFLKISEDRHIEIHCDLLKEIQNIYLTRQIWVTKASHKSGKSGSASTKPSEELPGIPKITESGIKANSRTEMLNQLKQNLLKIAGYRG